MNKLGKVEIRIEKRSPHTTDYKNEIKTPEGKYKSRVFTTLFPR